MNPPVMKERIVEAHPILRVTKKTDPGRKPTNHRNERAKGIAEGVRDLEDEQMESAEAEKNSRFNFLYRYWFNRRDWSRETASSKEAYRRALAKTIQSYPVQSEEWYRAVARGAEAEREFERQLSSVLVDKDEERNDLSNAEDLSQEPTEY